MTLTAPKNLPWALDPPDRARPCNCAVVYRKREWMSLAPARPQCYTAKVSMTNRL
jgi:hypothetical protein